MSPGVCALGADLCNLHTYLVQHLLCFGASFAANQNCLLWLIQYQWYGVFCCVYTGPRLVTCRVSQTNRGNVRLGNVQTSVAGCNPTLLLPQQSVNCTYTR